MAAAALAVWLVVPGEFWSQGRVDIEELVTQVEDAASPPPISIPAQPAVTASSTRAGPTVRVSGARVNLHAEPSLKGDVVTKLLDGDVVTILDCAGQTADGYTWWYVTTGDDHEGWVAQEFFDEGKP